LTSAQRCSQSGFDQVFGGRLGVRAKHLHQDSECVVRIYTANASPPNLRIPPKILAAIVIQLIAGNPILRFNQLPSFMNYLLYLAGAYALLLLVRYVLTFLQLRKNVFQYPSYELTEMIPDYLKDFLQSPIQELEQMGFQVSSYLQVNPILKLEPVEPWAILLHHKEGQTYGVLEVSSLPAAGNLYSITFTTFFPDGSVLLTTNGKESGILGKFPNTILQDPHTPSTLSQWQVHQDKLNQLPTPPPLSPQEFTQALVRYLARYMDVLIEAKAIAAIPGTSHFQLTILGAIRKAIDIMRGNSRVVKMVQQRAKVESVEMPMELQVAGFLRMQYLQQNSASKKFRAWMLLLSFGAFIVSYTKLFEMRALLIFVGVLLLHEAGHIGAMMLCGYRNPAVLFIPFLGALATARKEDATLAQKFWIAIAGPLPGLAIGLGLAIFARDTASPWLQEATWMLISLNLFNLLPLYPLDGGHIADLLLFSRNPYVGVVFKGIGALGLGLIGLGQPLLLCFAVLIGLTIPSSFRAAKAYSQARQDLRQVPKGDQDSLLRSIFQSLEQSGYGKLPFSQKHLLVTNLIARHHESRSHWTTRLILGVVYCGSLGGAIAGTLEAVIPNGLGRVASLVSASGEGRQRLERHRQAQQQKIEQLTRSLQRNPNDAQAYIERAKAQMKLRNVQAALADYDQAIRINPEDTSSLLSRAQLRLRVNNTQGALQDYDRLLQINPQEAEFYRSRAYAKTVLKDYQSAIADYNKVIQLYPQEAKFYTDRAYAKTVLKDYQSAIADYNKVIQLQPQEPGGYLDRGYLLQEMQDYPGAIADAETSLKLDPKSIEAYELRSEVRRLMGDETGAIADERKMEELYETYEED
jgi:tetratricopeptide (TPR) repeat protein